MNVTNGATKIYLLCSVFSVQGPYDPDQTMRMHCVMTEKYALQHFKITAVAAVAPPLTFSYNMPKI